MLYTYQHKQRYNSGLDVIGTVLILESPVRPIISKVSCDLDAVDMLATSVVVVGGCGSNQE